VLWNTATFVSSLLCFFLLLLGGKKYIDEGTFWLLLLMFQTLEGIDERSSLSPLQKKNIPTKKEKNKPPSFLLARLSPKNLERACQISNISEVSQVYTREREGETRERLYSLYGGSQEGPIRKSPSFSS
jgi:hypothetical protein